MSMQVIINLLSKCGTFMVVFAVFYFLFKYTIFKLMKLNKIIVIKKFYLDDILSIALSLLFIINFVTIYPIFSL